MNKFIKGSLFLIAVMGGGVLTKYYDSKELSKREEEQKKQSLYTNIYTRWIANKSMGREISNWLLKRGYHKIAIYGMAGMGKTLYMDLQQTAVKVCYFIDRNVRNDANCFRDKPIIRIQDIREMEAVDAIVVTPFYFYSQIKDDLNKAGITCPIVSLETMII